MNSQHDPKGAATRGDTAELKAAAAWGGPVPRAVLGVATLIFGGSGLVALLSWLVLPMMFDAPGSDESIYTWLLVGSILLYPFFAFGGLVVAWRSSGRGDPARALKLLQIPLLGATLVAVAVALLQVVCGGSFTCR
jgi:hypothetical protein